MKCDKKYVIDNIFHFKEGDQIKKFLEILQGANWIISLQLEEKQLLERYKKKNEIEEINEE